MIIKIGGIVERSDISTSLYQYKAEEGMEIAREFVGEVLEKIGQEDFRLLAVSGSVARTQDVCHDVDIIVVCAGRLTENFDHPIYGIKNEFIQRGKAVDIIPVFRRPLSRKGWFYLMSARLVNDAIPLYENPDGYLSRLKGILSKNRDHYLEVDREASLLKC